MNTFTHYLFLAWVAASALLASHTAAAQIALQPSPNGEVSLVVSFQVKPGAEKEFESVFQRSVICSRLEPGNITFNLHKVMGAERSYVLYEVWRNEAAVNSHFAQPYTVALFAMFDRNLARPLTQGGLQFVQDLQPQPRAAAASTNPASLAACR